MENQQQKLSISSIENRRQVEMKSVSLNVLPIWVLGKIFCRMSITERLRRERVNRRWRATMWEFAWKGQKKLSYEIVSRGAERVRWEEFTNASLVALFKRFGENLNELHLSSFFARGLAVTTLIYGSLPLLPNLTKIDIVEINLLEAVQFLPDSLREIDYAGPFNEGALTSLASKCPQLEAIEFRSFRNDVSCMNDFLSKYPSLKKLIIGCPFLEASGKLTSIGELKELEEFTLWAVSAVAFDEATFEAMTMGCKRLRRLVMFARIPISEVILCSLANLMNLVELVLPFGHPNITDIVIKAISKCRNLKKLHTENCQGITDESIACLMERCKSLVTLVIQGSPRITEKSLEAVVAEVKKRYGDPPKQFPNGPTDDGIFLFACEGTAIDRQKALDVAENNPWLTVGFSRELYHRSL